MKVLLVVLAMVILIAGGYIAGRGKLSLVYTPPTAATTQAPVPTEEPTPTQSPTQTITAGVTSGLSFSRYTINVPASWTETREHEDEPSPLDVLTLTRGEYKLKIFQAATGGAMCLYPGDADLEGPSSRFTTFVALTTRDGTALRRSDGKTVCQASSYGGWQQPTNYGHISITIPQPPDATVLSEIDAMLSSLTKVQN